MAGDRRRTIPRERIDLAEKLYLAGKPTLKIQRKLCEAFGVSSRTARRYIERARARLARLPKPPPEAAFARAEAMLLEAFTAAKRAVKVVKWSENGAEESRVMPAPETGAMVAAATRLAELHGVTGPKRVDVTTNGQPLHALPDEELDARIRALESTLLPG